MSNKNNDYLYQSGELDLDVLLDDNTFQDLQKHEKEKDEKPGLYQDLVVMNKYDVRGIKHF